MTISGDRAALLAAVAVAILGFAWAIGPAAADEPKKPLVGEPAPDIDLPATQIAKVLPDKRDATSLNLKDLRGKNVVLYFFPKAKTRG
jgi:hypothetical protein